MDKLLECIYEDAQGRPIAQFQAERDGWYMCAGQIIKWLKKHHETIDMTRRYNTYKIGFNDWDEFLKKYEIPSNPVGSGGDG